MAQYYKEDIVSVRLKANTIEVVCKFSYDNSSVRPFALNLLHTEDDVCKVYKKIYAVNEKGEIYLKDTIDGKYSPGFYTEPKIEFDET